MGCGSRDNRTEPSGSASRRAMAPSRASPSRVDTPSAQDAICATLRRPTTGFVLQRHDAAPRRTDDTWLNGGRSRLTETSHDREDDHAGVGAACRRHGNGFGAKSAQLWRERALQLRLLRLVQYRHGRVHLPRHPRSRTVVAVSAIPAKSAIPTIPASAAMAVAAAALSWRDLRELPGVMGGYSVPF